MSASKGKSKEQEAKEAELRKARRDALKRMAGLGIALTIPSALAACGDEDSGYDYYSCKGFECGYTSSGGGSGYYSGGYKSGGYSSSGYSSYGGYKSSYSSYHSYHSQYCNGYGSMYYYSYHCYYS